VNGYWALKIDSFFRSSLGLLISLFYSESNWYDKSSQVCFCLQQSFSNDLNFASPLDPALTYAESQPPKIVALLYWLQCTAHSFNFPFLANILHTNILSFMRGGARLQIFSTWGKRSCQRGNFKFWVHLRGRISLGGLWQWFLTSFMIFSKNVSSFLNLFWWWLPRHLFRVR
jgi:hypothetical protein